MICTHFTAVSNHNQPNQFTIKMPQRHHGHRQTRRRPLKALPLSLSKVQTSPRLLAHYYDHRIVCRRGQFHWSYGHCQVIPIDAKIMSRCCLRCCLAHAPGRIISRISSSPLLWMSRTHHHTYTSTLNSIILHNNLHHQNNNDYNNCYYYNNYCFYYCHFAIPPLCHHDQQLIAVLYPSLLNG